MSDDANHGRREATPVELSDAAIDWLVKLGSGSATPQDRAAFERWRALSPAHERAAQEAETLMRDVGATRQAERLRSAARSALSARPAGRPVRRRMILAGAAAASVAAVAVGLEAMGPLAALYADHATRIGERRRIELPDGSVATLNTATALSLDFTDERRRVVLHAGEASFDVAKDPNRPFTVVSEDAQTRAVGTIFAVKRTDRCADVVVSEGIVEVRVDGSPPVRVGAGQRLDFTGSRKLQPRSVDTELATAWQRGKLIFNRRPLDAVVAELARYRPGRILVVGERAKALQVTGVFDLDDPDRLLRTLEDATQVRISRLPMLTIIR
jgi:transmembrane sensor